MFDAGVASAAWKIRGRLSPAARQRARSIADVALAPIGSISGGAPSSNAIGLTFDDGPDPLVTPSLLDLLQRFGVRATFFVLTDRISSNVALVKRIAAEGHEVALHADRHDRMTTVPATRLFQRLRAARRDLEDTIGQRVCYFRPPFGAQSLSTYLAARACGLDVVVWQAYAEDWVDGTPESVADRGLRHLNSGDILLLHDGLEMPYGTPRPTFDRLRAFELILAGVQHRGLTALTVGRLLSCGRPKRTAWFRP